MFWDSVALALDLPAFDGGTGGSLAPTVGLGILGNGFGAVFGEFLLRSLGEFDNTFAKGVSMPPNVTCRGAGLGCRDTFASVLSLLSGLGRSLRLSAYGSS